MKNIKVFIALFAPSYATIIGLMVLWNEIVSFLMRKGDRVEI